MKILNLYAGLGGNRRHWGSVDVVAVEIEKKIADVYKANFPNDKVIIGDAHQYLLDHYAEFDFIWTSPPCQTHSKMAKATRHKLDRYPDMGLYQEIIFLQHFFKGKFVVENVKSFYEPLLKPTTEMGRHIFWANFEITPIEVPNIKNFINIGTTKGAERMKKWLGINYEGNIYYRNNHCPGQVLRNCIHPDLGLHILEEYNRQI